MPGKEEEGVLYQVLSRKGELDDLAARQKNVCWGCGIGIYGTRLAMQMQRLPKDIMYLSSANHDSGSVGISGQTVQEQLKRCLLNQSQEMNHYEYLYEKRR